MYKIRLVVLDNMEYRKNRESSVQVEWFRNVLEDARENSLAVVCACHYPYSSYTHFECPFEARWGRPLDGNQTIWVEIVDEFVNSGGEFVCWINGHMHTDHIGYVGETHQLTISIDTAATGNQALANSDIDRTDGTISQDLFNLVAFDTTYKVVKIQRIGANRDIWMRYKDSISIQYASNDEYVLENNIPQIIK